MRFVPFALLAALALSLSWTAASQSSTDLERRDERRIERTLRGRTDKDSERFRREEEKMDEQGGGGGKLN